MEPEISTAQEVSKIVCFLNALQHVLRLPVWRIFHTARLELGQSGDEHLAGLALPNL